MSEWRSQSLDPENWDDLKQASNQLIDYFTKYLSELDQHKAFLALGRKDYQAFHEPIPYSSMSLEDSMQQVFAHILSRSAAMNLHPGFWAWAMGGGSPAGYLASIMEAGLNLNVIGGMHISCLVEEQVLSWLKEMFGFSHGASGVLTSGCSEANLIALTLMRNSANPMEIPAAGLVEYGKNLVIYASTETHISLIKAAKIIGLGQKNIRIIPVNEHFEMDLETLESSIRSDCIEGNKPIGIVANFGTIHTGAVDDINKLSQIAKREKLWLHIDGAFGAFALLTQPYHDMTKVVGQVDSLAFDLHKWMGVPYGCGCLLTNHRELHRSSFSCQDRYIEHDEAWLSDFAISLSRNFQALPVWFVLKTYGLDKLSHCVENNIQLAKILSKKIEETEELELLAPVSLNVVCFRYAPIGIYDREIIDKINRAIINNLTMGGDFFVSGVELKEAFAIRACFLNYRTTLEEIEKFAYAVVQTGKKMELGCKRQKEREEGR